VADPEAAAGERVDGGDIGAAVVGDQLLNADAAAAVIGDGSTQKGGGGRCAFVGEHFGVGEPAVVVGVSPLS
jgi:hypothetical protein